MSECGERAVLVVTRNVEGTSTTIARQRVELSCSLAAGHTGPHEDARHKEAWEAEHGRISTLLRHEDVKE